MHVIGSGIKSSLIKHIQHQRALKAKPIFAELKRQPFEIRLVCGLPTLT
jgi:hypothetical protein